MASLITDREPSCCVTMNKHILDLQIPLPHLPTGPKKTTTQIIHKPNPSLYFLTSIQNSQNTNKKEIVDSLQSIKNWMGPNPNGALSVRCDRDIRYSALGVRSVGPVGDFLDSKVHNFSIVAETPLMNYTHFLIYTASPLAELLGCWYLPTKIQGNSLKLQREKSLPRNALIPGSSTYVKFLPFGSFFGWKSTNFTHLEDPDIGLVQTRLWTQTFQGGYCVYQILTPPKINMDVSENSGTPKSSILIGFSIINHPFWGTPIFGNIHIGLGLGLVIICSFVQTRLWNTNIPPGYTCFLWGRAECEFGGTNFDSFGGCMGIGFLDVCYQRFSFEGESSGFLWQEGGTRTLR